MNKNFIAMGWIVCCVSLFGVFVMGTKIPGSQDMALIYIYIAAGCACLAIWAAFQLGRS